MRILVGTWSRRTAGGTETYLGRVMEQLARNGHQIGFCFEVDEPDARPLIPLPPGGPIVRLRPEPARALDALRAWQPDVVYAHGFLEPGIEEAILGIAPTVFVAHSYYGTCISGEKTHKFPIERPCDRRFGPACLALYFPRRCGGLNPVSMLSSYDRQRRRLALLHRYAAVVTPSAHMQREFVRHGVPAGRVFTLPHGIGSPSNDGRLRPARREAQSNPRAAVRMTFVGRMDRLKGGRALIDALPRVKSALDRPLQLTFAGAGPARGAWERHAQAVVRGLPGLAIDFAGWLEREALSACLDSTDVVVMPSLWPEPFGLAGLEANRRGIPVVGFATGGIPEWLKEGVNGCLAPGDPPTVQGLADALVRCVRSLEASDTLILGAAAAARTHGEERHLAALLDILDRAARHGDRVTA